MSYLKQRDKLSLLFKNHLMTYPTPKNISYAWSFGSASGLFLAVQILTGIFLAMHYTPHVDHAFLSVDHIMRNVQNGWLIRYAHANGASFFFFVVYLHIARGLYYGSYLKPRTHLWLSGILIYFLMAATAFIGYVLPWGQMSFWGATVITNLFSAIPGIGKHIVFWIWGGFSVENATLNRFFSLHYLLPFILAALAALHLTLLHSNSSNQPLGFDSIYNIIPFYPFFWIKDFSGFLILFIFFFFFIFYMPDFFNHSDNYIPADALVTPAHIVPEWYFLPFYAILRSIPNKLGGVVFFIAAILIFLVLPFLSSGYFRSNFFKPLLKQMLIFFFANVICLGWIGMQPVEDPYIFLGQICTSFYFLFFVIIFLLNVLEKNLTKKKLMNN